MQTFCQETNSSDVLAHSPVVSESHFLNIPCPNHGGNTAFGTPRGETQMFGSPPLEFLELLWTKGERPEVEQNYLFCPTNFLPIVQNGPADKAWAFLVGKTHKGCGHGMTNSSHSSRLLGAARAPLGKTSPTNPQPAEEGPASRQTTPSPWHRLCLFTVAQRGGNPGPQEVSRSLGSRVPCRGNPSEDAQRSSCFSSRTARESEEEMLSSTLNIYFFMPLSFNSIKLKRVVRQ